MRCSTGGGGNQVQRGPHPRYVFRGERVFFKTSACPRFVKEGYFFVPRYEVLKGGGGGGGGWGWAG